MRALKLANLITQVRDRADLQDTLFVKDEEIERYLDQAYFGLYNEIVEASEDYFTTSFKFKAIGRQLVLPADFYKLRAVDLFYGNYFYTLRPVKMQERQDYQHASAYYRPYRIAGWHDIYRYNIEGEKITFFTQEAQTGVYVMHYVPQPKKVGEAASLPVGWENYLICKAAQMCRVKEESSYREFALMADEELNRIRKICQQRDMSYSETIIDVYKDDGYLSLGDYGASLETTLSGVDERTLFPYVSECPYPDFLDKGVYRLKTENSFLLNSGRRAVLIFDVPDGLNGQYGKWVACDVRDDRGFVWLSANKNSSVETASALRTSLLNGPVELTIDSQIYIDDVDGISDKCLYYDTDQSYRLDIGSVGDVPRVPQEPRRPRTGPLVPKAPTQTPVKVSVHYLDPVREFEPSELNTVNDYYRDTLDDSPETIASATIANLPVGVSKRVSVTTPTWPTGQTTPRHQLTILEGGNGRPRITGYFLSGFFLNQVNGLNYLGTVGERSYYISDSKLLANTSGTTKEFEVNGGSS